MEYESYRGEFTTFERRGTDVLREEGEILTVLKSFDAKAERMVAILSAMNEKLGWIDERQDKTVEILEDVKEDTSAMLEKQDKTIGILEDVREDMGEITNALTFLNEIYRETVELREKYELLSGNVEAIKMKMGGYKKESNFYIPISFYHQLCHKYKYKGKEKGICRKRHL